MIFKNAKQLEYYLLAKCKNALAKAQERAYLIIDRFIRMYYGEYSPKMYKRTYELYCSLVKSDIIPTGTGYKAEVYVDLNYLNHIYSTGSKPTGEDVMHVANLGIHGVESFAMANGTEIWNDSIQILDEDAINILKNMLIAEGIPIK